MYVGQPIDRIDGRHKVTGAALYAAEFPQPDLVHAVLVQSTVAAGEITGFDQSAAAGMPGVLAIITPDNAPKLNTDKKAQQTVTAPLLQDRSVLYNGQHVAVVVADTFERATAAGATLRVQYRAGEAVTDMHAALSQAYPPKRFRNGERSPDSTRGDPDGAFNGAALKVEATYETPTEHHNPMEPHATIARWDGDRLTVWTATQAISGAQRTLATMFGIDPEQVLVICPFVGGGFGCKGNTWPPATLAAMASRVVGRPVKLVVTRQQMFTSNGYRPATVQRIRLGADADGRLVSVRHDGITQMSQPALGEFAEPVALATEMLYACPNAAITHRLVGVHAGLPTYMRAPGEASGVFAIESAMDELAVAAKLDPIELRLRNYAEADPSNGKPFASKPLRDCYARGADAFGWAKRDPAPRSMRDGRVLIGCGMATTTYPTNRSQAEAKVRLNADGSAIVQTGSQDLGTGTYTVLAQVAADALGLPLHRVRVELGDSRLPPAPGSGGSQTAASVASAVLAASEAARAEAIHLAIADRGAAWGGADPGSFDFRDGIISGPPGRVGLSDVLGRHGVRQIQQSATTSPGDAKKTHSLHSFGAHFAEVRVDPDFGTIRVSRWVGAFDCGKLLNAKTAESQLKGGIVFGIGMALLEETRTDPETGRITNANIAEYLVPVNADVPDIRTIVVDSADPVTTPLGIKGIGELPTVGVAAAIANAVYHATGVRVRRLPIRLEDVLMA
ncbi:MAG: xanthine dehydrogenase family protein molybdopterin-binding subunit [Acetobacteraceae bacterium]|nr:xanthine dehydrogenase family protein molybdopterin-binding subunit [Acetobacteraceae bacterium]